MDEAEVKRADAPQSAGDGRTPLTGHRRPRWHKRVVLVAGAATLVAAAVVLPPLVNIGRYKGKITALMAQSMGRPVRLSGVELRLLPAPGFVLRDLQVSEDPQFGAEPILSARTVVAAVRLTSLWRGKLAIRRVSVDEASLNLVRSARGRWNLESLLMGARQGMAGSRENAQKIAAGTVAEFPYLEATGSRVNLKNGVEKSPYSLVDTDLSLWQDEPGKWRVRLRGQPVRTDIQMSLADTGEVRLEARLQTAAQLRDMPVDLQMEWRNAQLGQLSRLITGSDAGWRGDLTADIDVKGTADSALTKTRLRATGVRRAEFAPETPLDFDANCTLRYQHSLNAAHDVNCNTAIGDGRLHLKAELPGSAGVVGNAASPEAMLEIKDVPVQAGLDLLRTIRAGFAPGVSAKGTVNGSLAYKQVSAATVAKGTKLPHKRRGATGSVRGEETIPVNLQGSLIVDGLELSGGELKEALRLPRIVLAPKPMRETTPGRGAQANAPALRTALVAEFVLPLGAAPKTPEEGSTGALDGASAQNAKGTLVFEKRGFQATLNGTAALARLRELAYAFGWPHLDSADSFTGGTADFDLAGQGPWIVNEESGNGALQRDSLNASLTLHRAEWRAAYLLRPVELPRATLSLNDGAATFAAEFSYGKSTDGGTDLMHGSVAVEAKTNCASAERLFSSAEESAANCTPKVRFNLGAVDAAAMQTALLGAPEEKTLLSPLMDRMRGSDRPKWPECAVEVQAESLALGPLTVQSPMAELHFQGSEVTVEDWEAALLGGIAQGKGHFAWVGDKPVYALNGEWSRVNAAELGALLNSQWAGGPFSGNGSVQISGRTGEQIAASALGEIEFAWQHGSIPAGKDGLETHFDDWQGNASIVGGRVRLGKNRMVSGKHSASLSGEIPFSGPAVLTPEGGPPKAGALK